MASSAERLAAAAASMQAGDAATARAGLSNMLGDVALGAPQRIAALRLRARATEVLRDFAAAFADLQAVATLAPNDPKAWSELGMLHAVAGDSEQAIVALRRSLALDAGQSRAWNNLGSALWTAGSADEAIDAFDHAIALDPTYAHALANLGTVLRDVDRETEAIDVLERAITQNPRQVNALTALASLKQRREQLPEAIKLFALAAREAPGDAEVCMQLGRAMAEADDLAGARRVFAEAARRAPTLLRAHIGRHLLLPNVYVDEADVARARAAYVDGLGALERELPAVAATLDAGARIDGVRWSNFLLAYQGEDDLPLQRRYAALLRRLVDDAPGAAGLNRVASPRHGKPRIGFVSSFFRDGTVGRYFESWITGVDRSRYDVIVYHLHAANDALVERLRAASDTFRAMPRRTPSAIARTILDDAPDVLIYPELGMDATTYALATLRLAPLQCAAWGHPVTTGHAAIDLYFSSDAMEPADGETHYSEHLVRLPGIGTRYRMPQAPDDATRVSLGLPQDRVLFMCPQSVFKIHPRDDALFAEVLRRNPRATLLLFNGLNPFITARYRTRISRALQAVDIDPAQRIIWMPGLRHDQYLRVNSACDAMLDTTRWSGGNTSLDAIASALPIVTWPGRLMRARQSAGMLRLMGADELVAGSEEEYLAIASRIADDRGWRDTQSALIRENRARLFDDPQPVAALYTAIDRHLGA